MWIKWDPPKKRWCHVYNQSGAPNPLACNIMVWIWITHDSLWAVSHVPDYSKFRNFKILTCAKTFVKWDSTTVQAQVWHAGLPDMLHVVHFGTVDCDKLTLSMSPSISTLSYPSTYAFEQRLSIPFYFVKIFLFIYFFKMLLFLF